jgi:cytidine deaminase
MNQLDPNNLYTDENSDNNNLYFINCDLYDNFNSLNDLEQSEKKIIEFNEKNHQMKNSLDSKQNLVNNFDDNINNQILLENSMIKRLIKSACKAREQSYSPYSNYCVGAAILDFNDNIFVGTNWENASIPTYPFGICGEICAISNAIAHKSNKFKAIAIVGDKNNVKNPPFKDYAYPCAICAQVLSEFGGENLIVIIAKSETDYIIKKLIEILP